jgi:hypothetical protein
MRIPRDLHLADFIKIVEHLPNKREENFQVRVRNPDEEVLLSSWITREFEAEHRHTAYYKANA